MAIPFAVVAVKQVGRVESLVKSVEQFIGGIKCQLKGSCSPKFQQAVLATGGAVGYKRVKFENGKRLEWWFLNTTEYLSWDNAAPNAMKTWYQASGYWQKLKDAGLDSCCLKQTFPPAEAFPDKGNFAGVTEIIVDGVKVQVDKGSYDPSVHKFDTLAVSGDYVKETPVNNSSGAQTNDGNLLMLGAFVVAGYFLLPKLLK